MGNGKLLLGLGLGAIIGSLATCFVHSSRGKKMKNDLCNAIHELEEDADGTLSAVKNKVVNKVNYAKGRVDEKIDRLTAESNK